MKRPRRTFTTEFKRRVVEEFLGGTTQAQLCRLYELSPTLVREWCILRPMSIKIPDQADQGIRLMAITDSGPSRSVWRAEPESPIDFAGLRT